MRINAIKTRFIITFAKYLYLKLHCCHSLELVKEDTELYLWILKYAPVCCRILLSIFRDVLAKYSVNRLVLLL